MNDIFNYALKLYINFLMTFTQNLGIFTNP